MELTPARPNYIPCANILILQQLYASEKLRGVCDFAKARPDLCNNLGVLEFVSWSWCTEIQYWPILFSSLHECYHKLAEGLDCRVTCQICGITNLRNYKQKDNQLHYIISCICVHHKNLCVTSAIVIIRCICVDSESQYCCRGDRWKQHCWGVHLCEVLGGWPWSTGHCSLQHHSWNCR